jgi:uncharacterized membrane protein
MKGARILGHSIHPILIVFPLGLLATAVIFDLVGHYTNNSQFATASFYMIAAGLIGGALAAVFGWIDWFAIPSSTRAKSVGLFHGLTNAVVLVLFAASWYLRYTDQTHIGMAAHILSVLGFVLALVGGWLGGELVERLGVSVHPGANVNAPNSLTTDATTPIDQDDPR